MTRPSSGACAGQCCRPQKPSTRAAFPAPTTSVLPRGGCGRLSRENLERIRAATGGMKRIDEQLLPRSTVPASDPSGSKHLPGTVNAKQLLIDSFHAAVAAADPLKFSRDTSHSLPAEERLVVGAGKAARGRWVWASSSTGRRRHRSRAWSSPATATACHQPDQGDRGWPRCRRGGRDRGEGILPRCRGLGQ